MAPTLFIHAGPSKTGSTSIQHALADNRERFRTEGVYMPNQLIHTCLFSQFSEHRRFPNDEAELEALTAAARDSSNRLVLVSCEFISGLHGDQLTRLADFARQLTDQVTVALYLRHPLDHFASTIQQRLKQGVRIEDSSRTLSYRPMGLVTRFVDAFGGAMRFRPFGDDAAPDWNVVEDFGEMAGLSLNAAAAPRLNPSLSARAALVMDEVAALGLAPLARRKVLRRAEALAGPPFEPDHASVDRFRGQFDDDVAWLEQELKLRMPRPRTRGADLQALRAALDSDHEAQSVLEEARRLWQAPAAGEAHGAFRADKVDG